MSNLDDEWANPIGNSRQRRTGRNISPTCIHFTVFNDLGTQDAFDNNEARLHNVIRVTQG